MAILVRRFFLVSSLTLLAFTVPVVVLNYVVDPYRIYQRFEPGDKGTSLDLFWYARMHKAYAVGRLSPNRIVAGSSRSAGISPESLPDDGIGAAYNLAIPGATLYEVYRFIEHTHVLSPLSSILLVLDFEMAGDSDLPRMSSLFNDARLRRRTPNIEQRARHYHAMARDYWATLMSRSALTTSLKVLLGMSDNPRIYRSDGTWIPRNVQRPGSERLGLVLQQRFQHYRSYSGDLSLGDFRLLLELCRQEGIELKVLISPSHAGVMQLIERAGLWQTFVGFQQEVAEMTAEVLGSSGSVYGADHRPALVSQAIFAGNSPFRDGIHMTEQASAEVASCLRESPGCDPDFAPEKLTPSTIDDYLDRLTAVKDDYRHVQPDDYRYLRQLEVGSNLD